MSLIRRAVAFLVLLGLGLSACDKIPLERGLTPDEEANPEYAAPRPGPRKWNYGTKFEGVPNSDLKDILEETSRMVALEDKPPASRIRLIRRIEDDVPRLVQALNSEGYYDGKITYRLDEDRRPIVVHFDVTAGPAYVLDRYDIEYRPPPGKGDTLPVGMSAVGLKRGIQARGKAVVEAQKKLLEKLGNIGHPLARVVDRRVTVDHETHLMSVTLQVDPGPLTRFGPVRFDGLKSVDEPYLRKFVGWTPGSRYDQSKVAAFQAALRKTGLFDTVVVEHPKAVTTEQDLPLTVKVTERKPRSVGVGLSYSSSEGAGGEAFWEHRNLFGEQENLRISLTAAQIRQALTMDFRKPNWGRLDQDLISKTAATRQRTDAYVETSVSQFAGLERKLGKYWRIAGGGSLEYFRLIDNEGERNFVLPGLPGSVRRDDTDNPLDPTRGSRLQFQLTPYYVFGDEVTPLLSSEVAGSAYLSLLSRGRIVVAARAKIGSIIGAETKNIPASKRFYSGGGGSVRGYAYQKIGPLDSAGDPLGGRSVFEAGLELRFRITDTIGLVPFIEAGNVYDDIKPDFSQDLLAGAGLGFRYYTAVGPVRLDIAVPLNRREGIDDAFQFYISLGQAF